MSDRVHVTVNGADVDKMPVGAVIVAITRGTVVGVTKHFDSDELWSVEIEGATELQPATFEDAAKAAVRMVNDRMPVDFPMGQRELHAP